MRRAPLSLAVALLASLAVAGGGQARSSTQCASGVSCPDLAVSVLNAGLSPDQRTVTVTADVTNPGLVVSAPTTVEVSAPGWTPDFEPVRALKPRGGDHQTVTLQLPVPDTARGHRQSFTVQVDPKDLIDESDETNNSAPTQAVFFPAGNLVVALNTPDGFDFADAGRTLVLHATVRDAGKGVTAETVLSVVASGWSGSADVPSLDPGANTPVDLTLRIPDRARGTTATLAVAVDPDRSIAETSYADNVSNTIGVRIEAGDLTVAIVQPKTTSDRKSVSLTLEVTNAGTAPTSSTSVQASVGGSSPRSFPVRSIDAGGTADLPATLALPASAAGTTVTVQATVDPAHDVAESNYENNDATPASVFVPAKNVTTTTTTTTTPHAPPNLVVKIVRAGLRSDPELTAVLDVTNTGGERSLRSEVVISAPSLSLHALTPVPAIAPGQDVRLSITRQVPGSVRGRHVSLSAVVDPSHDIDESSYSDNASAPFFLISHRSPARWPTWLGLAAGVVLVLLGVGYGIWRYRLRLRVRWQGEAHDEPPTERCQAPETYVWRRRCKAKPALRSIEDVTFWCDRQGEQLEHRADKELVESLNSAVRTNRSVLRRRRLERQIVALANDLCRGVEEWHVADLREQVGIGARLEGGKLECEFKRYKCVGKGSACHWQERQKWTGEVKVETDEPVTLLTVPLPLNEDERARALAALQGEVLAFVKRVDFLGDERPPEAAPIPH